MKIIKKITIYIFIFYLLVSPLYAQTPKWVSTEVQTRCAVIEIFTSIYRRTAYLQDKTADYYGLEEYPGKVIVINNHCDPLADSLAMPNQPDLRTEEGSVVWHSSAQRQWHCRALCPESAGACR